ncbi:hypothetical protein HXX76_003921 [Chlamydomonas incerta]|uniref:SET domain-containing protein n=1 Tax=Chlamydomonas incerta TaxID=51695 RepID=A0A835T9F4_CHLIN|nr:hypothetical protein HXX76_003921 [Chlamydomonas incerta]|eukprot:KAG2441068.1 hypothetical protein HXX76_003921 [Chlamydomonas incerta]
MLEQHEQERQRTEAAGAAPGPAPGPARPRFSRQPLALLAPIRLSELRLGCVHTGKYVLCRTLVTPYKLRAVATVVTDCPPGDDGDDGSGNATAGQVMRLLVHNHPAAPMKDSGAAGHAPAAPAPAHHRLPAGTVLAIKEPYLAAPGSCPGGGGGRAAGEAAAEAEAQGSGSGRDGAGGPATSAHGDGGGAAQWQSAGNALFGSGHFVDALHAYQQGLAALQAGQAQQQQQQQEQQLVERTATLLNNSAAACLGFGAHESARAYASLALRRVPGDAGALLHLAKALDGLGRYAEAADACAAHLNALSGQARSSISLGYSAATTTDFAAGQRFLQSLRRRVAEAERGEYDEAGMAREAAASAAPRLEAHADFIGPVAVADAGEGRGRGLYTTAAVRAGQLLLAMRADVASFAADVDTGTVCHDDQAAADVAALGAANAQLKWDLPAAVLGCGRLVARLAHLHAGGQARVPPVPPAEVCGFLPTWRPAPAPAASACDVEGASRAAEAAAQADQGADEGSSGAEASTAARAFELAVQGAFGSAAEGGIHCAFELGLLKATANGSRVRVDLALLQRRCVANGFAFAQLLPPPAAPPASSPAAAGPQGEDGSPPRAGGDKAGGGGDGKPAATGLWGLASYLNHACVANAHRYFLGDFMFLRASRDLPARAELSLTYLSPALPPEERAAKLLRRGFACGCELCAEDAEWRCRRPEQAQQVAELLAALQRLCAEAPTARPHDSNTAHHPARPVVGDSAAGTDHDPGWRAALFGPASRLARALQACGDLRAAAQAQELALCSLCHLSGAEAEGAEAAAGAKAAADGAEPNGAGAESAATGISAGGDATAAPAGAAPAAAPAGEVAAVAAAAGAAAAAVGKARVVSPEAAVQPMFADAMQRALLHNVLGGTPLTDDSRAVPLAVQHEQARRRMAEKWRAAGTGTVPQAWPQALGSVRPRFSRQPLARLAPIRLSELRLGCVHTGKYVLCRTLVTPYKLRAVATVVTDCCPGRGGGLEAGACQRRLSVYNLATKEVPGTSADVSRHCLPAGTVLAIKEPYYRLGSADSQPFLRVDSPMDMLVVTDPRHPLVAGTPWARHVAEAAAEAAKDVKVGGGSGGSASAPPLLLTSGDTHAAAAAAGADDEAAQWQSAGNALFGSGHFVDALHAYQQGLAALQQQQQQQPEQQQDAAVVKRTAILLNNSAAACLGFGAHESARAYAQLALRREPGNAKALMRLAKALDGLGRYSEAAAAWEAHLAAASYQPGSSPAAAGQRFLQSLRRRAAEAERGEYDEAGMAREAAASAAPRLEAHADFIGPVAVADAGEGRGRGLYTTAAVRAGQLLLAMRADAVCYMEEVQSFMPQFTSTPGVINSPTQSQLNRDLPISVLGCRRFAARLAHLHAGDRHRLPPVPPAEVCGFAPTWQSATAAGAGAAGAAAGARTAAELSAEPGAGAGVEATIGATGEAATATAGACGGELAVVECGIAAQHAGWAVARGLLEITPEGYVCVDAELLERISSTNAFTPDPLPEVKMVDANASSGGSESGRDRLKALEAKQLFAGTGLWSLASFINHACSGNATRYFLGDFMLARASLDLPAGAEVTFSYTDPLLPLRERAQALRKHGFVCGCELCREDLEWRGRHPDRARRVDALSAAFAQDLAPAALSTAGRGAGARQLAGRLRGLLDDMGEALRGRAWRTALVWPSSALAMLLRSCGDYRGALAAYDTTLAATTRFPTTDSASADDSSGAGTGGGAGTASAAAAPTARTLTAAFGGGGGRHYLTPAAIQTAVNMAATWAEMAGAGGRVQRQAARQQAQRWEATARGIWSVFYGSQELFEARFKGPLRLIQTGSV